MGPCAPQSRGPLSPAGSGRGSHAREPVSEHNAEAHVFEASQPIAWPPGLMTTGLATGVRPGLGQPPPGLHCGRALAWTLAHTRDTLLPACQGRGVWVLQKAPRSLVQSPAPTALPDPVDSLPEVYLKPQRARGSQEDSALCRQPSRQKSRLFRKAGPGKHLTDDLLVVVSPEYQTGRFVFLFKSASRHGPPHSLAQSHPSEAACGSLCRWHGPHRVQPPATPSQPCAQPTMPLGPLSLQNCP